MEHQAALDRLEESRHWRHRSVQAAASGASGVAGSYVVALGLVVDLEMWWIVGLLALAAVGLEARVSVRGRFDWSRRDGAAMVIGGGLLALALYVGVQFPVRAADWSVPNTVGGVAAAVVILLVCRAGLLRMARGE